MIDIVYKNNSKTKILNYRKLFVNLVEDTLNIINFSSNIELSVTFVNNEIIQKYNKLYRNIDQPTDVLSFAQLENQFQNKQIDILNIGDIFININYAIQQSTEYSHSLKREICFLFVHGLLHLLGYEHKDKQEEKIMTQLQEEILSGRKIYR